MNQRRHEIPFALNGNRDQPSRIILQPERPSQISPGQSEAASAAKRPPWGPRALKSSALLRATQNGIDKTEIGDTANTFRHTIFASNLTHALCTTPTEMPYLHYRLVFRHVAIWKRQGCRERRLRTRTVRAGTPRTMGSTLRRFKA